MYYVFNAIARVGVEVLNVHFKFVQSWVLQITLNL